MKSRWLDLLKRTYRGWVDDKASRLSAALAYYSIFSIAPLLVIIRWRHVWFGALITGLLFEVGKTAVSWYLGREGTASAYGAAGSVVFVLMWVYFASSILFFGAEFTQVYADAYEGVAVPAVNAFYVPVGKRGRRNRQAPVMAIAKSPPPPVLPALLSGTLAVLAKIITPAFIKSTILPHALKFLAKK